MIIKLHWSHSTQKELNEWHVLLLVQIQQIWCSNLDTIIRFLFTVSLTCDRAQGDDSKHDSNYTIANFFY